jgi:hypothetical protein
MGLKIRDSFDERLKSTRYFFFLNIMIMESTLLLPRTNNSLFIFSNPLPSVELGEINLDELK